MPRCPDCGQENPAIARFCLACAAPLQHERPPRELRKTVTVLFCDLAGSTSMGERLDSETVRRVMSRYYSEMRAAIERHGGTVEKFIGDAVMAVFGVPTVHEDDALRAVRAAADMQAALAALNDELERRWGTRLEMRIAVNTGEVVAGHPERDESFVVGDPVNMAARLEQSAAAGEVLLGRETYRLLRDAVRVEAVEPLAVKGKSEPVPAFRMLEVMSGAPGLPRRLDSPIVGRADELRALEQRLRRALEERRCELVTVLGPAGVGKSRLVKEFTARLGERARVLHGRCLPYGDGITFWPIAEVVRRAADIGEENPPRAAREKIEALLPAADDRAAIVARLAAVLGLEHAGFHPEESFWAVRRLVEALAAGGPLIVVLDDIHCGEPTFFDLLEYLESHVRDAPMLLLCMARPELREHRPALTQRAVVVAPLDPGESKRLIANLLGPARLAGEVRDRILGAAEGNPLFVEEMLRMLVDDGVLSRDNGQWTARSEFTRVAVPPTIQALLAARLDRLQEDERAVLECASVIGQEFWRGPLGVLCSDDIRESLGRHLGSLIEKELIRPGGRDFADDPAYRFGHILVRDVAYQGLLKDARAELHERFADWLEDRVGDRLPEYEEILGYHLEQAYRYRETLGPVDRSGRTLARRAAERLGAAGRRAHARGDMRATVNLLQRATSLMGPEAPERRDLRLRLGLALHETGELGRADEVLQETKASAASAGDEGMEVRAELEQAALHLWTSPDGPTELRAVAERALVVFERLGDDVALARAWQHLADVPHMAAHVGSTATALGRALEHARRARDGRQKEEILLYLGAALYIDTFYGPTSVEAGIRRAQALLAPVLEMTTDVLPRSAAVAEAASLAGFEAMRGHFERARQLCWRAERVLEDLGQTFRLAVVRQAAGWVELLADAPAAAEKELRSSYQALQEMGEKSVLSTTAAMLAQALEAQGGYREAKRFTAVSEEAASPDDLASQILWRSMRAKLLAREGQLAEAETLSRRAVAIAAETEAVNLHADALRDLAWVLRCAGRANEAASMAQDALVLYERKGNVVSVARVRALVEEPA